MVFKMFKTHGISHLIIETLHLGYIGTNLVLTIISDFYMRLILLANSRLIRQTYTQTDRVILCFINVDAYVFLIKPFPVLLHKKNLEHDIANLEYIKM